ncbi:MAG: ABC transporter ATP-binding protein [Acidobacteria bacterium]|nr:ABC transporter ATP-binding protein [Acidobacteriota bacterium]MBI3426883.1 ABC transporter ATP-binding protein [Acidobacteriota bacterium]
MARELAIPFYPETRTVQTHADGQARAEARTALRVQHLVKYIGDELILDDVSFSVAEGESLVLLGPSGSGKSTTLRLLAGLAGPDGGGIFLKGRHIEHLRARERNIGVIFQHYSLFPRMTVAENIAFGLKIRGVKKQQRFEKADEMLTMIGLTEHRDKYPAQLSGGQQQRVAIARALAYEPDLLLFDESFSALDPQTRVGLRREIRALLRRLRVPAIFITHDQEEGMELGDQIAILNRGRIEQIGSPYEVYNEPQTEFVATFLGAANVVTGRPRERVIEIDDEHFLFSQGYEPLGAEQVKIVFRPEDIVLGHLNGRLETPHQFGRAEVLDVAFAGATESLTVRLLPKSQSGLTLASAAIGARPAANIVLKVTRTKWDAHRLPLQPGDVVTLGLKSYKLLCA